MPLLNTPQFRRSVVSTANVCIHELYTVNWPYCSVVMILVKIGVVMIAMHF